MSLEVKKYTLEMLSLLIASLDKNELKEEYVTLEDYNNLKASLVSRLEEMRSVIASILSHREEVVEVLEVIDKVTSELK